MWFESIKRKIDGIRGMLFILGELLMCGSLLFLAYKLVYSPIVYRVDIVPYTVIFLAWVYLIYVVGSSLVLYVTCLDKGSLEVKDKVWGIGTILGGMFSFLCLFFYDVSSLELLSYSVSMLVMLGFHFYVLTKY